MPSAPNAMYRGDATSRPAMTIKTRCQAEISNRLQTQCVVTMTSLSAMRQEPGSPIQNALLKEFEYDAVRTCAGDSSCAHACPVQTNAGVTMQQLGLLEHTQRQECVAERIAARRGIVETMARASMLVGNVATEVLGGNNRIFGGSEQFRQNKSLPSAFVAVSERVGWPVIRWSNVRGCRESIALVPYAAAPHLSVVQTDSVNEKEKR